MSYDKNKMTAEQVMEHNRQVALKRMERAAAEAAKYDAGKPQLSLIPYTALHQLTRALEFGAKKYGRDNWKRGMNYTRLIDATLRHILAFNEGENRDKESGISHLGHAMANLAFLIDYTIKQRGTDDRTKAD